VGYTCIPEQVSHDRRVIVSDCAKQRIAIASAAHSVDVH
jgi:hypothetical protein